LSRTEHEVEKHSAKRAVVGLPIGESIRTAIEKHRGDLGWLRKVGALVFSHITVMPGGGKPKYVCQNGAVWRFDPERVTFDYNV